VPSENTEHRKLVAIMFTDMVGYSALSQRNEALALELLAENQRLLRTQFPLFNGGEVKTTGDGFLVEFPSALQATHCAVEIQRAVAARNGAQPVERRIQVRIGIHVGDVVYREADMYGDGVNIAARIEPLAVGGGICLSDTVYAQVWNKLEVEVTKLDSPDLKHIEVPMDVYRVVLPWEKQPESSHRSKSAHFHRSKGEAETGITDRPRFTSPAMRWFAVAAGAFLVAGLGGWLLSQQGRGAKQIANSQTSASAITGATDQKSIAVLPFVSMSPEKSDEYLSDGMTEELLNVLAKVPGLHVPGRSSSFAFKGKTEDGIFRKVGDQLHVATVLEGSVRKAGDKLRITAQLINVADGFHLWSETYDADMKDILSVQSDVAQRVVQALQLKLGVEATHALTKKPTDNPEAYRLYLLGRYHFAKSTEAGWTTALRYFNDAVTLAPDLALAWCGAADTYGWMGGFTMTGREAWVKEKQLAEKALAIDPNIAEAHLSLGVALGSVSDWQAAEGELKRSLELNPNLVLAWDQYAWLLASLGRFDEAVEKAEKAIRLDPLSPLMITDLGHWLELSRRYDESIAQCRKALEIDPNFAFAHVTLGWDLVWKGETATAGFEFEQAKQLDDQPFMDASLAYAHAVSGKRAMAEQTLLELDEKAKHRFVSPSAHAIIHLGLGEKEKALEWLDRCYLEQDWVCWFLKVDPLYDSVRNEPRFQALLLKVGLAR